MNTTPRVLKEMAEEIIEGPLRTVKSDTLADALWDAAERIDHLNAEIARLRESLKEVFAIAVRYETGPWMIRARAALAEQEKKS